MKKTILLSTITAVALVAGNITIENMPQSPERIYPSIN